MNVKTEPLRLKAPRGPAEHARRAQILQAAQSHFRDYGYARTSVADLAGAIGVSTAYIYRFFDSKRSIGEAICAQTLGSIAVKLNELEAEPISASEKLRRFYRRLLDNGYELLLKQRKMHDLVASAVTEHWDSVTQYRAAIADVIRRIVVAGRNAGEFETRTPLNEVVHALAQAAIPFAHPLLLEQRDLKSLREGAAAISAMALRSLRSSI